MPLIRYNPGGGEHTVQFALKPRGESFVPTVNNRSVNITGDGNAETLTDFVKFIVKIDALISEPEWEDFTAWYAWAIGGGSFAVELAEDRTWATAVEPGGDDQTVYVFSTAGIHVGDVFFIRDPSMLRYEMNTVGYVLLDHIIIADSARPLKYLYPAGSLIRFNRFYPKAVLAEKAKMLDAPRSLAREKTAEGYRNVSFEFMEVPMW